MSNSVEAEMTAELDRLHEAVRAAPQGDTAPEMALWKQVSRLPTWFFIARGSAEQPHPYSAGLEQGPVICIYSSAARATEAGRLLGLTEPGADSVPVFGIPMPDALEYVIRFQQAGAFGVSVDHPQIGSYIPLANLGIVKKWALESTASE
ncbi:hypothetical protein [Microbacterium suwonense]|uniref:SseB protein N-terminal domain-containing protein n=1 Tax=Microbacterium suwonense TaxID=683047 RepID=A0ABM8FQQ5_9MICO|nr:hypothetical protein [Microbacterium suwonense]BDZ38015.1 hypothetical protein GCM10025863_06290 [Microbacterium suwonense]